MSKVVVLSTLAEASKHALKSRFHLFKLQASTARAQRAIEKSLLIIHNFHQGIITERVAEAPLPSSHRPFPQEPDLYKLIPKVLASLQVNGVSVSPSP